MPGCSKINKEAAETGGEKENKSESESSGETAANTQTPAADVNTDEYAKYTDTDANIYDNQDLYPDTNDASVINMYLTVSRGNAADGTDHSWAEVNTYSADYYDENGIDRYNVEGLLKIDETGNGLDESSFGYGEEIPNVAVQIRGQTSTEYGQKNYKIRIKKDKGLFRGQRTLALNKHQQDPFRFTNKLAYSLAADIPQLIGGRTQFVHLFVKDETGGIPVDPTGTKFTEENLNGTSDIDKQGHVLSEREIPYDENGYADYGLYTMVEQVNHRYLKAHGLDENAQLYKVNFFEWNLYDEIMNIDPDEDYDTDSISYYLETKGNKDISKLQGILNEINNYVIPIDEIVSKHFNLENLYYYYAFQILIGNYDTGARNQFIYSPQNSEKLYFINWDMDVSFQHEFNENRGYHEGGSWERGITQYTALAFYSRMMKEQKYVDGLTAAINDLKDNYLTRENIEKKAEAFSAVAREYNYKYPDSSTSLFHDNQPGWEQLVADIPYEVDNNYKIYMESLKWPWPFYIDVPQLENNEMSFTWGVSYDPNDENVTYSVKLATDYNFENVLYEEGGLNAPLFKCPFYGPGTYYLKVQATNSSGYTIDCFDYVSHGGSKVYGCYEFEIDEEGNASAVVTD